MYKHMAIHSIGVIALGCVVRLFGMQHYDFGGLSHEELIVTYASAAAALQQGEGSHYSSVSTHASSALIPVISVDTLSRIKFYTLSSMSRGADVLVPQKQTSMGTVKGATHFIYINCRLLSDHCRPGGRLRKDYNKCSTVHLDNTKALVQQCGTGLIGFYNAVGFINDLNNALKDYDDAEKNYDGSNARNKYCSRHNYYVYDEQEKIIQILSSDDEIETKDGVYPFLDPQALRMVHTFMLINDLATQEEYLKGIDSKGRAIFSEKVQDDWFENGGSEIWLTKKFKEQVLPIYQLATIKESGTDCRTIDTSLVTTTAATVSSAVSIAQGLFSYYSGSK